MNVSIIMEDRETLIGLIMLDTLLSNAKIVWSVVCTKLILYNMSKYSKLQDAFAFWVLWDIFIVTERKITFLVH